MKKTLAAGIFLGACFGFQIASAEELDLACVTADVDAAVSKVRQIIISDDGEMGIPEQDQDHQQVEPAKQFALVIELVGGENGNPPDQKLTILQDGQFILEPVAGIPEEEPSWLFTIIKTKETFACSLNGTAHANPALTRGN